MRKAIAVAVLALAATFAWAQSTTTDTWTNVAGSGSCQTTVRLRKRSAIRDPTPELKAIPQILKSRLMEWVIISILAP